MCRAVGVLNRRVSGHVSYYKCIHNYKAKISSLRNKGISVKDGAVKAFCKKASSEALFESIKHKCSPL